MLNFVHQPTGDLLRRVGSLLPGSHGFDGDAQELRKENLTQAQGLAGLQDLLRIVRLWFQVEDNLATGVLLRDIDATLQIGRESLQTVDDRFADA